MGAYKRGDTWGISYFHNGKRIRKTIGTDKGEWRGLGGENLFNLPKGGFARLGFAPRAIRCGVPQGAKFVREWGGLWRRGSGLAHSRASWTGDIPGSTPRCR